MKRTVESCRRLDVRHLQQQGYLSPGGALSLAWQNSSGEQVAFLRIQAEPEWVLLRHRYKSRREDWQEVKEVVPLTWTPCHFGGERPWFLCPGVVRGRYCGRRVAVLYTAGSYFCCRQCCGLAYESQRKNRLSRLVSKAQKIRLRLGRSASLKQEFPSKPRWMHWQTYERLRGQAEAAEYPALIGREKKQSLILKAAERLTRRLSKAAE